LNFKASCHHIANISTLCTLFLSPTVLSSSSTDTGDDDVRNLFAEQGKVELISVPKDKNTGQPRGFAFVDMSSDAEVQAAVDAFDGSTFGGRVIRVTKSVAKDQVEKKPKRKVAEGGGKIYVGNLPFDATKEELMDYYGGIGEVLEVYIPINPGTGTGRGYAFVTMKEGDVGKRKTNVEFMAVLVVNIPLPPQKREPAFKAPSYVGIFPSTL
jgi:RNA recognition motif-containing protein